MLKYSNFIDLFKYKNIIDFIGFILRILKYFNFIYFKNKMFKYKNFVNFINFHS